ncbi:MAG: hypothetical protein LH624_15900 [Cryobacterium sp.]|nr:hypothetical protein [Cryobacterium sp.]
MRDVVICEPLRTPIGRFGGVFRAVAPADLAAAVIAALLERTGGRYLLETMCIGGGQGLVAIFEKV